MLFLQHKELHFKKHRLTRQKSLYTRTFLLVTNAMIAFCIKAMFFDYNDRVLWGKSGGRFLNEYFADFRGKTQKCLKILKSV